MNSPASGGESRESRTRLAGGVRNLQTGKNKAPKLQTHLSPAAGRPGPGFPRVRGRGSYGPSRFSQLVPTPKSNPTHGSSARTFRLFLCNPGLGLRGQLPPRREVGAGPVLSSCPRRGLQLALGAPLQSPGALWHSDRGARAGLPGWRGRLRAGRGSESGSLRRGGWERGTC